MTTMAAKPTLDSFTADEIFDYFRFGMRRILNLPDLAIPTELFAFVEPVVQRFVEAGQAVPRGTLQRFFLGELTDGIVPKERLDHQEEEFRALEWFFAVLEMLRCRTDAAELQIAPPPKPGKKDLLREGKLGPFVLTQMEGNEVGLCWACREEQPVEVIMALKDPVCTGCGAVDKLGFRKDVDRGKVGLKPKPTPAGKPRAK